MYIIIWFARTWDDYLDLKNMSKPRTWPSHSTFSKPRREKRMAQLGQALRSTWPMAVGRLNRIPFGGWESHCRLFEISSWMFTVPGVWPIVITNPPIQFETRDITSQTPYTSMKLLFCFPCRYPSSQPETGLNGLPLMFFLHFLATSLVFLDDLSSHACWVWECWEWMSMYHKTSCFLPKEEFHGTICGLYMFLDGLWIHHQLFHAGALPARRWGLADARPSSAGRLKAFPLAISGSQGFFAGELSLWFSLIFSSFLEI